MPDENLTIFARIETLTNYVMYDYFRRVLSWPMEKTAYEMQVNLQRLMEWVNARGTTMTVIMKAEKGQVEKIRAELEARYPMEVKTETRKEKAKRERVEKLDLKKVVKEFIKGKSLADLATTFKVDFNDFRMWWNKNLAVINQQVKQLRG